MRPPEEFCRELGNNIRRYREVAGLTQRQLAERTAKTPSMICQYERGSMAPNLYSLVLMADVLGVSVGDMVPHVAGVGMNAMRVALEDYAMLPTRAHDLDAGIDLLTPEHVEVEAHSFAFVDTGVRVELPHGTRGHVCSKSGLNRDCGITVDGTIDEGYTGTIGVTIHNDDEVAHLFTRGQKIAQLVIEPILRPKLVFVEKDELISGERGEDGFGSTGA